MSQIEEYKVDKNLCIDCNACYTNYPEIFKQIAWNGETKADAYAPTESGKYNPWDIVGVCPTDAISKEGEMPAKPEAKEGEEEIKPLEDLGPWEVRWERAQSQPESKWEVMKRYGMAATLSEEKDHYLVKVAFPERAPLHILTYKSGLPDILPDYKFDVSLSAQGDEVIVKGLLTDPHFKKLCGKINSFPDRFTRKFKFSHPVSLSRQVYRGKVLTLEILKQPQATQH